MKNQFLKLCLVTQGMDKHFLQQAVAGGVTLVQLRLKNKKPDDFYHAACAIKAILDPLHVPLIINDNAVLAKEIDAAGVHLGQSDMPPEEARELLGPGKIIGWSIETLEQLDQANALSCIDYVAASAVFPSQTKTDCKTIWGIDGLKKIVELSHHPVVAIGGIHVHNAADVMATGVAGIAVVSAIHDALDPKEAAEKLSAVAGVARRRRRILSSNK